MPADISIEGADRLADVARRLKETGDQDLRKELYRGINRATTPLKNAAKDAARSELPKRGGLNEFVASARLSTSSRGGNNPGVRITARKAGHDVRAIDRGRVRHPVFGNRGVWVNQQIKPGWFTKTLEDGAPVVRRELVDVLDNVARRLARG